jgi:hypothetical protein
MSELLHLQRWMADAVMQPLTSSYHMRRQPSGRSVKQQIKDVIKPNDRLSSFERLEVYNRQYWFRVLDSFAEDFPGLRAVLGAAAFDRIAIAYISQCPSRSYTLAALGSRLASWMSANPGLLGDRKKLSLEMAKLEWAHIAAFEAAEHPALATADGIDGSTRLKLQPYLHLFHFHYPVDDLLLAVREAENNGGLSPQKRRLLLRDLASGPVYLAVHRSEFSVHYKRLDPEAFCLLRSIQRGASLGEAVEAAFKGSGVPAERWAHLIEGWFANWMELGWFCAQAQLRAEMISRAV